MASETTHWTIGGALGAVAAGFVWFLKHLREISKEETEIPTVREWKQSQKSIMEGLDLAMAGLGQVKAILIQADIPGMQQLLKIHAAEIDTIKAGQVSIREDIEELRRDAERQIKAGNLSIRDDIDSIRRDADRQDERIDGLTRRLESSRDSRPPHSDNPPS